MTGWRSSRSVSGGRATRWASPPTPTSCRGSPTCAAISAPRGDRPNPTHLEYLRLARQELDAALTDLNAFYAREVEAYRDEPRRPEPRARSGARRRSRCPELRSAPPLAGGREGRREGGRIVAAGQKGAQHSPRGFLTSVRSGVVGSAHPLTQGGFHVASTEGPLPAAPVSRHRRAGRGRSRRHRSDGGSLAAGAVLRDRHRLGGQPARHSAGSDQLALR